MGLKGKDCSRFVWEQLHAVGSQPARPKDVRRLRCRDLTHRSSADSQTH